MEVQLSFETNSFQEELDVISTTTTTENCQILLQYNSFFACFLCITESSLCLYATNNSKKVLNYDVLAFRNLQLFLFQAEKNNKDLSWTDVCECSNIKEATDLKNVIATGN